MEIELKIYMSENAESFDFSGNTYTETTSFIVNLNESYPISVKPKENYTFNIWYQYGVYFEDPYSQNTILSVNVESDANCIPNIV